jgi:hypothetical protein
VGKALVRVAGLEVLAVFGACTTAPGAAASGAAARGDAALGDAALGDAALGDAALGDAALGDAALGDAALGDAALGDAATGKVLIASDAVVEIKAQQARQREKRWIWFICSFKSSDASLAGYAERT